MRRVAELDGVRGIAILLVLVGHLATGVGPYPQEAFAGSGEFLLLADTVGVQVFFALSGYLISRLLLGEVESSGTISLRRFWWRRLRRLYPPILAICAAYLIVMLALPWTRGEAWAGSSWAGLGDIAMALTYTTNFAWLFVPFSGWLGHTWSLAVEEQFYLVWPIVVLATLTLRRRSALTAAIVAGILLTVVARAIVPESVVDRGFRWDALLLGALVAVTGWRAPRMLAWVGVAAVVALSVVQLPADNFFYTASAIASAVVVAGAHHLGWLRSSVLVHLGHISYSLYLWHVFVMRFSTPWWLTLTASLAAAELSYRVIERRFMVNPPDLGRVVIDLRRPAPNTAPASDQQRVPGESDATERPAGGSD